MQREKIPRQLDENFKIEALKSQLEKIYNQPDYLKTHEQIVEFAKRLEQKYSDYNSYKAYHLLIGSTPPNLCSKFDFPGEDSIEKFIKSKIQINKTRAV